MNLDNLVKTNQIKPHTTHPDEVQRLLTAATRNLADARVEGISDETRFGAAYKAIMQCALVGLMANGYRPSTSMPGHHQTMIQTLSLTLDVPREQWIVMDALRKKRNVNDYSGDLMEPESLRECIAQADTLLKHLSQWLAANRADLLAETP
ncbi:MAG: DNA-binding protein [Rhodanobacter sp.]